MARPVKNNKSVLQSYTLTTARYDFSVYEKRILYRLVEIAQEELQGKKLKDILGCRIERTLFGDTEITMPIRRILANEEDKNYLKAKKAFKDLNKRQVEETYDGGIKITNFIERVDINVGSGVASFRVAPNVWDIILNFTKGYRKYELKTTMSFKSVYSMRFYELMSGQNEPLKYGIDKLRNMLCLENKFKSTPNLERKVLDVAKAELDEYSPYSFRYDRITVRSRGRGGVKVTGYIFYPQFIHKNVDITAEEKQLQAQIPISSLIPRQVYDYLINKGLTKEQLSANKAALHDFCQVSTDPLGQISIAWGRSRGKANQVGYFINAIKGMTKDAQKGRKG